MAYKYGFDEPSGGAAQSSADVVRAFAQSQSGAQSSADVVNSFLQSQGGVSKTAAPAQQQAAPENRSALGEVGRQLGLTGRAAVTGLTSLPTMVGDATNSLINMGIGGVNRLAGTNIPELAMPSAVVQQGMNAVGVPQPQNAAERVVQDVAGALAGTGGQVRLGQALAQSAAPVAAGVGRALATAPGGQLLGAAGSAGAAGTARENGAGVLGQTAAGLLGAAVPVAGASLATRLMSRPPTVRAPVAPENVGEVAMDTVKAQAKQTGTLPTSGDATQLAAQLTKNPTLDPKATARAIDFQELGIDPTLGQVTREAGQYARERNIRGLQGVGDPLLSRFETQNQQLASRLERFRGEPAEAYQAGTQQIASLNDIDANLSANVKAAYKAARESTGKDLDVPLAGVAQKYAEVLKNFAEKVPGGVRRNFEDLGIMSGTQKKTFTLEDADNLLKVINANVGSDRATNTALGQLRGALKSAVYEADAKGGPYANAVKLARDRFALHEAVPALADAASGKTAADDFVKRFIVNGKTDDVKQLAALLQRESPQAFQQAKSQIGQELYRGAFGGNAAGDNVFAPTRFAETLKKLGTNKLSAFFNNQDIDELQRISRVGSYINAHPAASAVNTSNTAAAAANMIGRLPDLIERVHIPGAKLVANLSRSATKGMEERSFVNQALAANLMQKGNKMTPQEAALAAQLLTPTRVVTPVKP